MCATSSDYSLFQMNFQSLLATGVQIAKGLFIEINLLLSCYGQLAFRNERFIPDQLCHVTSSSFACTITVIVSHTHPSNGMQMYVDIVHVAQCLAV